MWGQRQNSPGSSNSLGGFAIREGEHRLRMQAVERANELPPEHFEAMQAAPFFTAKVEVEGAPAASGSAAPTPEGVEILFPFGPAVSRANRVGQRPVKASRRAIPNSSTEASSMRCGSSSTSSSRSRSRKWRSSRRSTAETASRGRKTIPLYLSRIHAFSRVFHPARFRESWRPGVLCIHY